ncbi:MAG: hypothetical protein WED33_05665 [Bacteroidia bacterium]
MTQSGTYDVSYIAPSGCIYTDEISIALLPIGINDLMLENLRISPNPFTDLLQVKGLEKPMAYVLADIQGRILISGNLQSGDVINTSTLKSGY